MTQFGKMQFPNCEHITGIGRAPTRRGFFTASAVAGALSFLPLSSSGFAASSGSGRSSAQPPASAGGTTIRPFHINVPKADLIDLQKRIDATRWPERETVSDATQGVQLATMQKLAHYWANDYDWRKVEARLNALSQFVTTIDELDIHFIQVRSKHMNALPVIITHGWPGSIIEQLKIIGPLTVPRPTAESRKTRLMW